MRVTIVVLGDLGRSPRMQYHAQALAAHDIDVDVVAHAGTRPPSALLDHPRIALHLLPPRSERTRSRATFVVAAALAMLGHALRLVWLLLFTVRKPDVLLVQSPPAIPTLLVARVVARLRAARLVVDWHNLAWTLLALRLGQHHSVVRAARVYERALGRRADGHLCVSKAMQAVLQRDWGLRDVRVLYDRPAERFAPVPPAARPAVLARLLGDAGGVARRAAVIVSPTSWTVDEDYDLLLDAADRCETALGERGAVELLVVLTGRGALRERYEARFAARRARRVRLRTLWLEDEDYPLLLGAADLGLCLHRSASGLDLPMKIADMLGAGLPVCALDYGPCLAEQIRDGDNGLRFTDAAGLASLLAELFSRFPETPRLDRLRESVATARGLSWRAGWEVEAREAVIGRG
jgi:beta-1,4-mannosyltransferase